MSSLLSEATQLYKVYEQMQHGGQQQQTSQQSSTQATQATQAAQSSSSYPQQAYQQYVQPQQYQNYQPAQSYQRPTQQTQQYAPPATAPPGHSSTGGYTPPAGPPPAAPAGGYTAPSGPPPAGSYTPPAGRPAAAPTGGYTAPSGPPPTGSYTAPAGRPTGGYTPPPGAPPQSSTSDPNQQYFRYSRCTGTKKALLIGINYYGSSNQLGGCVNDVQNIKNMLTNTFGYATDDMVLLTDDTKDARSMPTRANILRAMQWLTNGARRDDSLFLHYSGHGTLTNAVNEDDYAGHAEAICPVDFQTAGLIVDDDMHNILVKPLPAGCRLTAVFDSCHSGSAIDLPWAYSTKGTVKSPNLIANAAPDLMNAGMAALSGNDMGALYTLFQAGSTAYRTHTGVANARATKTAPADVIAWGGCKDDQTSADTKAEGQATGAMSYAFVRAVQSNPRASYQQFLVALRDAMVKGGYSQKPQLSACHEIDTSLQFVI